MTTDTSRTTVAVLGLGIMGSAMARNLLEAGYQVVGWNRNEDRLAAMADSGVALESDLAAAVRDSGIVITTLAHDDAIEHVMLGDSGAGAVMRDGALWLQMSTVGIDATERFRDFAANHVLEFVDAPVMGTKDPAERGELVVLASGPDRLMRRAQPIFDVVGKKTLWLGPVGAGTRMKLVINDWILGLMGSLAESLALARALGVDQADFLEIVRGSAVDAPYVQLKGKKILDEAFDTQFPLKWAHKDAGLILDAIVGTDAELALTQAVRDQFRRAMDLGHGDDDMSAVYYAAWPEGAGRSDHR